jgi:hypothetical protein
VAVCQNNEIEGRGSLTGAYSATAMLATDIASHGSKYGISNPRAPFEKVCTSDGGEVESSVEIENLHEYKGGLPRLN